MTKNNFSYRFTFEKMERRLRGGIVNKTRNTFLYPYLYKSYWHSLLFLTSVVSSNERPRYTAIPNPGAGIGHQMANWIAGYWIARQFGVAFAHIPFTNSKWESFLSFGEGEIAVADLLKKGYKKVRLPLFDEDNEAEVALNKKIISSYSNQKVIFIAEQDQFYRDQFGLMGTIKQKFHSAAARKNDQFIFDTTSYNIAIHVRRGDIMIGQDNQNSNLLMRWQGNDYFVKVLENVLKSLETNKPIAIYLFSQGVESDFIEFTQFKNLYFCLDMNAQDSFLHMVFADLLISSKSSFSYKPALLNNGTKVCPADFWHGYPKTKDWVLVDNDGCLNEGSLNNLKLLVNE